MATVNMEQYKQQLISFQKKTLFRSSERTSAFTLFASSNKKRGVVQSVQPGQTAALVSLLSPSRLESTSRGPCWSSSCPLQSIWMVCLTVHRCSSSCATTSCSTQQSGYTLLPRCVDVQPGDNRRNSVEFSGKWEGDEQSQRKHREKVTFGERPQDRRGICTHLPTTPSHYSHLYPQTALTRCDVPGAPVGPVSSRSAHLRASWVSRFSPLTLRYDWLLRGTPLCSKMEEVHRGLMSSGSRGRIGRSRNL